MPDPLLTAEIRLPTSSMTARQSVKHVFLGRKPQGNTRPRPLAGVPNPPRTAARPRKIPLRHWLASEPADDATRPIFTSADFFGGHCGKHSPDRSGLLKSPCQDLPQAGALGVGGTHWWIYIPPARLLARLNYGIGRGPRRRLYIILSNKNRKKQPKSNEYKYLCSKNPKN